MFIGLSFLTFSKDKIEIQKGIFQQVKVLSDVEDKSIPKGKCKVFGKVFYEVQMEPYSSEFVLCDSVHSAYFKSEKSELKRINNDGTFEILLDTSITFLFFQEKSSAQKFTLLEEIFFENYKLQSQHKVEIEVYLPLKSKEYEIMVDKPVIYAYSENAIDFIINLKAKGYLTFTYPQLPSDHSWKMKTSQNGNLIDKNGNEFPYLFWEAKQSMSDLSQNLASSNEIIQGKDLVAYFEKELTNLGFNSREKTDFITYWCPKFISSKNVQVQFFIDDNCSVIGDLEISPKPDNLRRVYVLFQENPKVATDFVAKPLKVNSVKRDGFTVLEWGGSFKNSYEL